MRSTFALLSVCMNAVAATDCDFFFSIYKGSAYKCFGTRKTVVFRKYTKSPTVKTVNGKESETLQVSVVHGRLGVRIFQEGMH